MHVAQLDIFDADGCEPGPVSEVPEIQTKKIAASRNPGFFQDWKTNSLTRALTHSRTHARTHALTHSLTHSLTNSLYYLQVLSRLEEQLVP